MTKYLLLKHYRGAPTAVNDAPMDQWTPAEISAHLHIPLGVAVTCEFLGPLVLSAVLTRRARDLVWVALALVGVVALGLGGDGAGGRLEPLGVVLALVAGAFWAMSSRCACTVCTSPRTIGPVRAASPSSSALSRAAVSSGRSVAAGSSAPAAERISIASATRVTRWLAPWARPAW